MASELFEEICCISYLRLSPNVSCSKFCQNWVATDNSVILLWYCYCIVLVCYGIVMVLYWYVMVLLWYCTGMVLVLYWYGYGIVMVLL